MVADDLGDERQAQARTARLGRDERIEDVRHEIGGNARAVVAHGDFQRQAEPLPATPRRNLHAGPIARRQRDFAA